MAQRLHGYDALLSPTVPIVAPPIAPLLASDEAFFATNALLLRNPSHRQPARRLRAVAALPCGRRDAGRPDGLERRAVRRHGARRLARDRGRAGFDAGLTMRVAVVGAGIVGVTTAYELAAEGHEVTVFERRGSVAAEASFANAGVVAPGYVTPWAAPGMPGKVLAYLLARHAPVRLQCATGRRHPRLAVAMVARLQADPLPGQSQQHASTGDLQPRATAPADARTATRLRAQRRLPGAAARREGPRQGTAGPEAARRDGRRVRTARRGRLPARRTGPEPRDAAAGRHFHRRATRSPTAASSPC